MAHGNPAPLLDWARWNGRSARTSATSESGRPPIWERYQRFMKDNPHVLEHALELARTELAAGAKRVGTKALWEKLRARMLRVNGGKPGSFKFNNDFTALLARDLIAAEPKLAGKIELRERKTAIDKAVDEDVRSDVTSWRRIDRQPCDLCNRVAIWFHPAGGVRCATCPRPET